MHLVVFLEERSAKNVLDHVLPRILPKSWTFQTLPHQGKEDLKNSLRIKLSAWLTPNTCFMVLLDQDSNDCKQVKQQIKQICQANNQPDVLIRIACYELEAWYFGDLEAVASVYSSCNPQTIRNRAKFRNPDAITKPSSQLKHLIPEFSKGHASRLIPQHMSINNNTSPSFQALISGVKHLCTTSKK